MREFKDDLKNFYVNDLYIQQNPSLSEEDSVWKFKKITPLLDKFCSQNKEAEINLLDVGGGAGHIINSTSHYIQKNYDIPVNKYLLDLSPGILDIQKKVNPDYKLALQEDIQNTSLGNRQMDLTLMIDVLEHVPDPISALKELRRISKSVILKVPLEDNLYFHIRNLLSRGERRKYAIEKLGHIQIYNDLQLQAEITQYLGQIIYADFTNVFSYYQKTGYHQRQISKLINHTAQELFKISPKLCCQLFFDFRIFLVNCY